VPLFSTLPCAPPLFTVAFAVENPDNAFAPIHIYEASSEFVKNVYVSVVVGLKNPNH